MFDVGFWELVLLAVIALIVLGPERLPEVARTAGRWVARARGYANKLNRELDEYTRDAEDETGLGTLREELNRTRDELDRARHQLTEAAERFDADSRDFIDDVEFSDNRSRHGDTEAPALDDDHDHAEDEDEDHGVDGFEDPEAYGEEYLRDVSADLSEYGDDEPFSVERAREEHARRDRDREGEDQP